MTSEEFEKEYASEIETAAKLWREGDIIGSSRLIETLVQIRMTQVTEDFMMDIFGMEVNFREGE